MKPLPHVLCLLSFLFALAGFTGAEPTNANPTSIPTVTLSNGVEMPQLGFGTLYLTDELGARSVAEAIRQGYRLIDTATIYGNEDAVGEGIRRSGVDRSELFVSTKVWVDDTGYEKTKKAFETSLEKLGLDYVDLYLIHRPRGDLKGAWKAMEALHRAGKIRAIGVSNFSPEQLSELLEYAEIKPVINQIEVNPFFQQPELQAAMEAQGVQVEAWSPFAQGRNGLFTHPVLTEIGEPYGKTPAQVTLRWLHQRGIVPIPRTSNPDHMAENRDIFDFNLSDEEMARIATLDRGTSQFPEWE